MKIELSKCPFCCKVPYTRPGVCTGEIEIHHACLMGHVVNRGDWGNVWKTPTQVQLAWKRICDQAVKQFGKRLWTNEAEKY